MDLFRHHLLRLSLIGLFGLAILSVAGAFLGAERARLFFNSIPMMLIWMFLLALLVGGLWVPAVRRRPASLALHLGCALILAGSMWNSDAAHRFRTAYLGVTRPASGFMLLKPGDASDLLMDETLSAPKGRLPFTVRLEEFRIDYYPLEGEPWVLGSGIAIPGPQGMSWGFQAWTGDVDEVCGVPFCDVQARWLGRKDPAGPLACPVYELELSWGTNVLRRELGGDSSRTFHHLPLAPLFPSASFSNRSASILLMRNEPPVQAYVSRVSVLQNNQPVVERAIQVNQPLHHGGYHLYQHSCDKQGQRYTILRAVEDSGMRMVYAGFILLGLGVVAHFWLRSMFSRCERSK